MDTTASTLDDLKTLVGQTLGITDRVDSMDAATGLLGSMPELDSMAVVELITAIGERFGFEPDEADFTADAFETLGTLAAFVDEHRA
jgi:acyl carrier protein